MAVFKPFRALRPRKELAEKVAALPYDVYSTSEAREVAKDNPYSFLHTDKAEIDFDFDVSLYSDEVYEKAASNFKKMIDNGWLIKDDAEGFYLYRLEMGQRVQTGIAGLASIDEYNDGTIKKHEYTREDKEKDRIRHIESLNAQTGLIFLAYKADEDLKSITENYALHNAPIYDMSFDDGTKSKVWRITQKDTIEEITKLVTRVSNFYIADGHHRNAAAVKVGTLKRHENKEHTKDEPYNFCLSVIFPDDELFIMDYNRVVADLNGLSNDEFMDKVSEHFDVFPAESGKPKVRHEFGMYVEGKWYKLKAKDSIINEADTLKRLDVSILQQFILEAVLNIKDIRTNKRIDFIGGIKGIGEIEKRVDSGEMKVGFSMFPTSMLELIAVADDNKVMPPKSTWFEPKLRSGIFIHEI